MITKNDLTNGEKQGDGLFEELMRAAGSHIQEEVAAGRLKGDQYAQVYLSMMQGAMQTATQYLLQYPITNKQLELMNWQISQAEKQNQLLDLDRMARHLANETAKFNLCKILPEQHKSLVLQNETSEFNLTNILPKNLEVLNTQLAVDKFNLDNILPKNSDLLQTQLDTAKFNLTSILPKNLEALETQISIDKFNLADILPKNSNLLQTQVDTAEFNLVQMLPKQLEATQTQIDTAKFNLDQMLPKNLEALQTQIETAQFNLTEMLPKQIESLQTQIDAAIFNLDKILPESYKKLQTENIILEYRSENEYAQTHSVLPDGSAIGGVLGKDLNLKQNQADAFIRNAEIQVAKLYTDAAGILYATDPTTVEVWKWGLGSTASKVIMDTVRKGVGVEVVDAPADSGEGNIVG